MLSVILQAGTPVHTTGVNWDLWAAITTVVVAVVGLTSWLLKKLIVSRIDAQDESINGIIEDAKTDRAAVVEIGKSVARVEGYLAASNGGGHKLAPVPYPEPIEEVAQKVGGE